MRIGRKRSREEGSDGGVPFDSASHSTGTPLARKAARASTAHTQHQSSQQHGSNGQQMGVGELHSILNSSYDPKATSVGDYDIDHKRSSASTRVLVNRKHGGVVVSHRGTNNFKDVLQDGLIAAGLGKLAPRVHSARRITREAEKHYGKPVTAVGHSFGGYTAEESKASGGVVTYNKVAGKGDIGKRLNSNQTDYRTRNDIVSVAAHTQHGGKRVVIGNGGNPLHAHSLDRLREYAS